MAFQIEIVKEVIIYEIFVDIPIILYTKKNNSEQLSATHISDLIDSYLKLVPPLCQKVKLTLKEILGNFNLLTLPRKYWLT